MCGGVLCVYLISWGVLLGVLLIVMVLVLLCDIVVIDVFG